MATEARKGRSYYYRSRRIDGRVVREYVAAGAAAELAAKRDREDRELRRQQQSQQLCKLVTFDKISEQVNTLIENSNIILTASLLAAGFHQHRSEWRKSHVSQSREAK
jgi:vacuolar-type H+-ATPase catalytic subunit A/Vma1